MKTLFHRLAAASTALTCLGLFSSVPLAQGQTPTLQDFGYGRMNPGDHRNVFVLLARFDCFQPTVQDAAYFDQFLFDRNHYPSLNGFYWENSCGRFQWSKTAIIGPLDYTTNQSIAYMTNDTRYYSNHIYRAMTSGLFDFAPYDANHDGYVAPMELAIFIIGNEFGGASRLYPTVHPPGANVTVGITNPPLRPQPTCTNTWLNNDFSHDGLANTAHEAAHQLGALDLYGKLGRLETAWGLSLMGITSQIHDYNNTNTWDLQHTYHLDPWHKLMFGWCEPRLVSINKGGRFSLPAAQLMVANGPIILYDETKKGSDFFILEYRTRTSPNGSGYDANVRSDFGPNGLVIWHYDPSDVAVPSEPAAFPEGAPDPAHNYPAGASGFARGSSFPWGSGNITPRLRWLDNATLTPCRIYVHPFHDGDGWITIDVMLDQDTWVDFTYVGEPAQPEWGTFDQPFKQFFQGVGAATTNRTVHLKPGSSAETGTIDKPIILRSYNGHASIGKAQ